MSKKRCRYCLSLNNDCTDIESEKCPDYKDFCERGLTNRKTIHNSMVSIQKEIEKLKCQLKELKYGDFLLSDKDQWFEEKIESHPKAKYQRKPNVLDGKLVGRIFWYEDFRDGDTGGVFSIQRQKIVRIDGKWVV